MSGLSPMFPSPMRVMAFGAALALSAGLWDLIYHLAPFFAPVQWSPLLVALGEFGHTLIFIGGVIMVFSRLLKRK